MLIRNYTMTVFDTSRNICFGYLLELPHSGDSNKYLKRDTRGKKNKIMTFLYIILLI